MQFHITDKKTQNLLRQSQLILRDEETFKIPTLKEAVSYMVEYFVNDHYELNGAVVKRKRKGVKAKRIKITF